MKFVGGSSLMLSIRQHPSAEHCSRAPRLGGMRQSQVKIVCRNELDVEKPAKSPGSKQVVAIARARERDTMPKRRRLQRQTHGIKLHTRCGHTLLHLRGPKPLRPPLRKPYRRK